MKPVFLLFLVSVIVFSMVSGCLKQDLGDTPDNPFISNVGVVSNSIDDSFELKVTVYINNPAITDTGPMSLKVISKDPMTNLITAERVENIGYLKAESESYKSLIFNVPMVGKQLIETELFEDGVSRSNHNTVVTLTGDRNSLIPNIRLTDLSVETVQATNYGKDIIVNVAPGITNEGAVEVDKVIVVITAISDPYTEYTGSTIVANLDSGQRTRASLQMTLPAKDMYKFKIDVLSDGKSLTSTQTDYFVKLHDLRTNDPVIYPLLESDIPVDEEVVEEEGEEEPAPGFGIALMGVMTILAFSVLRKRNG
ncbi:hypothetical protein V7O66_04395 [Methanolobus sp. ZRKC3]|uniref:DUF7490 domain-containing protein n=1 Tax=Methanolobus sp. ZRKC3 TaxID=3125786 RepID=UPI00325238F9